MDKYLALDLGGTFLKAAIIDENVNILKTWKVESHNAHSIEDMLAVFDSAILDNLKDIKAIGMSLPGRIDSNKGIMETAGWFDDFMKGFKIKEALEERYKLEVIVDNDAKCAASAESWVGALKDYKNGIVYVIGTAIGGGIIINHEVYRGSNFASGEFSQIAEDISKDIENGCFTSDDICTYHLLRKYKEKVNLPNNISGEEFFDLVNSKDEIANEILDKFCKKTANCLYNLQVVLDVEAIAIGGGISFQDVLINKINDELDKIYSKNIFASIKPKLMRCKFSNDANLIGAVKPFIDHR